MKKVGIVYTETWHTENVNVLVDDCQKELKDKVEIVKYGVSGSYELPTGARYLFSQGCHVVIVIGILLHGQTYHFESVLRSVEYGLRLAEDRYQKPIIYGVLCCDTQDQIRERTFGHKNYAKDWAKQAVKFSEIIS